VDPKVVRKLLLRSNKTSCGPDGILFSLYAKTAKVLVPMWVDLIQRVGEEEDWEDSFCEAQLCLLLKVEGIPRADQFRPISITNSDY
jgi:hypothetical protein